MYNDKAHKLSKIIRKNLKSILHHDSFVALCIIGIYVLALLVLYNFDALPDNHNLYINYSRL
jgi:hypothetical protein